MSKEELVDFIDESAVRRAETKKLAMEILDQFPEEMRGDFKHFARYFNDKLDLKEQADYVRTLPDEILVRMTAIVASPFAR